jgi:hypothetical protein
MSHGFIDGLDFMGLFAGKWDINTCMRFLMLSETTQKRLDVAPEPSRPCAVKKIATRRIYFLAVYAKQKLTINSNEVALCRSSTSDNFIKLIVNTVNLQITVLRYAFPSYHKIIVPLELVPSPEEMNSRIKVMQHQLMQMVLWYNENSEELNSIDRLGHSIPRMEDIIL